jgi:hypothetical protein
LNPCDLLQNLKKAIRFFSGKKDGEITVFFIHDGTVEKFVELWDKGISTAGEFYYY